MNALTDRPRVKRFIEAGARRALAAVGAAQPPAAPATDQRPPVALHPPVAPQPPPGAPARFARELRPAALTDEQGRASSTLYERLSDDDVREIESRIGESPELRDYLGTAHNLAARRHMLLAFGVHLEIPVVLEKTGLTSAQPPEDVHSMARGPVAAAGGLYEADLVADALASVGVDLASVSAGLDFGCSSGRVVKILSAAYPHADWYGCDPNEGAIAWASSHLPGSSFFASGDKPPLPLENASLDLACAISIWSHFEPSLGMQWFDEMHRLIRPGGHLVCTTHGYTAVDFYVLRGLRSPAQSDEIIGELYRHGWWYAAEFGKDGDWGVVNPSWGTAFLSPEWILSKLSPRWRILEFAPGRNQDNQDVYVLQRA